MKKIVQAAIGIILLGLFNFTYAQEEKDETIRVETDLVTVNVAVRDKQGKSVRGLRQEQFEIFDNQTKQQISYFSSEDAPVTFGIIYDMHPTSPERMTAVLDSLRVFTKNLRNEDRFFLTAFNHYGSLNLDFIPTVEQIEKNLSFNVKRREPNSLYDAIYAAANKIRESKSQKKTLLIISDGADHNSRHNFSDIRKQLKNLDVQIYAVIFDESKMWAYDLTRSGNRRQRISNDASQLDRAALEELTMKSGGTSRFPATENALDFYKIYQQIASEMREFYTLSFYPAEAADGKWHELRIGFRAVEGSKRFALTYRQGYQSPLQKR